LTGETCGSSLAVVAIGSSCAVVARVAIGTCISVSSDASCGTLSSGGSSGSDGSSATRYSSGTIDASNSIEAIDTGIHTRSTRGTDLAVCGIKSEVTGQASRASSTGKTINSGNSVGSDSASGGV
jgi:hypothetical protein